MCKERVRRNSPKAGGLKGAETLEYTMDKLLTYNTNHFPDFKTL